MSILGKDLSANTSMNKKHSIAVIIPYFGKEPWYFNFFIHSCARNSSVRFFIIADEIVNNGNIPNNVIIINQKFEEIKGLIAKKLGYSVALDSPHKLCDFKPAYGIIFDYLLQGFDFWAHCDIDIIFGNIRKFITAQILENYDIISVRSEFITGPFALYRNCNDVNTLFKKSKSHQIVFQTSEYCGFDECGDLCFELIDGASLADLPCKIESMTHVVKLGGHDEIKTHFDHFIIEGIPGNLIWDKGTLIYSKKFEVLLYHLILYKYTENCEIPNWKFIPDLFYINTSNFSLSEN